MASLESYSLDEWVQTIRGIYREVDGTRDPFELWLEVLDESAKMTEDIRKDDSDTAADHCISTFGWISSFVGKCLDTTAESGADVISKYMTQPWGSRDFIRGKETYQKWVLLRYPTVCHKCWESPCHCSAYRPIFENRRKRQYKAKYREIRDERKIKLKEAKIYLRANRKEWLGKPVTGLFEMFDTIYSGSNYEQDLWKLGAHLMEEIGEVSKKLVDLQHTIRMESLSDAKVERLLRKALGKVELSPKRRRQLETFDSDGILHYFRSGLSKGLRGELADVFSWLTAVWEKLNKRQQEPKKSFAKALISHYHTEPQKITGCRVCDMGECSDDCLTVNMFTRELKEEAVIA